jgi:phospholipase/lecithinase/hemolysin
MRQTNFALALLTAAALAACGGNGSTGGDQALKTKFASQVSFGDSLSDVGTYNVGAVKAAGGGKFTINGDNTAKEATLTGKNWTELLAAQLGVAAPCAAQTGLEGSDSSDPTKDFNVTITNHAECFNYAQGGARVFDPVGGGNKATGSALGQMTVPVVTQIQNHLTKVGGKFKGDEVVTVMAGGNDALAQLGRISAEGARVGNITFAQTLAGLLAAGATNPQAAGPIIGAAIQTEAARPGHTDATVVGAAVTAAVMQGNTSAADPAVHLPIVAKAKAAATTAGQKAAADFATAKATEMVTAMGTAGAQLAGLVKTEIIGKGANYVIVNNLPDIAGTPAGKAQPALQDLIKAMVSAFNDQLKTGLSAEAKVLYVDLYSISHDQVTNPAPYGLTNTSTPACGENALGHTSLVCTASNTIADDVSHYMFADDIHPTPFEYALVAKYVLQQMMVKGWL